MKKTSLLFLLCFGLGVCSAQAGIIGSTDPNLFTDTVDWCVQYSCNGQQLATPQPWTSVGGNTGMVGNVGTLEGFYVLQEDVSWSGNFPSGMGLVFNGAHFGNTPTQIAATFDQGLYGAGAWIQPDFLGDFTASIELFDSNYQSLGVFTWPGHSEFNPGTGLFIGAYMSSADVWAVQFDTLGGGDDHDFAIGTLGLMTVPPSTPIPEPGTLLLMGPSLLGLLGVVRHRISRKTKEVL